jgi:hypothetical protein
LFTHAAVAASALGQVNPDCPAPALKSWVRV